MEDESLRPLRRMRSQVASRAASDLSPLDVGDVPAEVRPLVAELIDLFARVRDSRRRFEKVSAPDMYAASAAPIPSAAQIA